MIFPSGWMSTNYSYMSAKQNGLCSFNKKRLSQISKSITCLYLIRLMNWCRDLVFWNLCKDQECQFFLWLLIAICSFIWLTATIASICKYDVSPLKGNWPLLFLFNLIFSFFISFNTPAAPAHFCPITVIQCNYVSIWSKDTYAFWCPSP